MTILVVTVFIALVPMMVYTAIIWWLDHWEREPLPLVIGCFFWGAVPSIILALVWSLVFATAATGVFYGETDLDLVSSTVIAPLTEETAKGLGLLVVFLAFRREIDSLLDGIVYGAVIGFGFAAVENVFYFISVASEGPVALSVLFFLRAGLFGLNHALFAGLTGLGFALARFRKTSAPRVFLSAAGLFLAMVCHGVHNFFVSTGLGGVVVSFFVDWTGILWLFVVIIWSLNRQGHVIRHYLAEEVSRGLVSAYQARRAGSFSHRLSCGFALFGHGITSRENIRRLDQLCAELAFKKHQLAMMGDEYGNTRAVKDLRRNLAQLSVKLA